ncbi:hypothetical protein SEUCBS140593_009921 [Sporothrix eucalyptigena]|uniref:Uncharacterized protein n=1 Tax=Sporothrix eucalyptigena TaxID=1812306 RepID=A0ABP0CYW8_9PEZI
MSELRQHCRTIAADAWLIEAKHYLQSKMSALLTLLELWATSTNVALDHQIEAASDPVVDFAAVRQRLRILEDEMLGLAHTFQQNFDDFFHEKIMVVFGTGRRDAQEAIVQGHLIGGDVFLNLGSNLATDVNELVQKTQETLRNVLENIFNDIEKTANFVYSGLERRAAPPVRRDVAFEGRLREFAAEVHRLKVRHKRMLNMIEHV